MAGLVLMVATGCAPQTRTVAPASEIAGDERATIARITPSVVRIEAIRLVPNQGRMVKSTVTGSGAIFTSGGHVLTNYHVADNAEHFVCYLNDGTNHPALLVGQDALTDLTVLQLDLSGRSAAAGPLPVATFGNSDALQTGDVVFAVGSPASLSQAVTRGVVANPSLILPDEISFILDGENVGLLVRWILHDASIFGGNSGGPLVNAAGEIVGINEIGVARLGGAIPGNLARAVAAKLVAEGRVVRGWSGLTVQPRLKVDGDASGLLVSDVAPESPGATAGLKPGDIILGCAGSPLPASGDAAVGAFYRAEAERAPGASFVVDLQDGAQKRSVELVLTEREPAQQPEVELRSWGAVFRDLTRGVVRARSLPSAAGVWIDNIRPGGPAGQADPELKRGDILLAVDGEDVPDVAVLEALSARLVPDDKVTRTVLARVRREGEELESVVELRLSSEHNVTPQSRRAWLGVAVQPLTPKLIAQLKVETDSGVRLTEIYPATRAEAAGLQIGDVVVAVDDAPVKARRAEDTDVFARQLRQYRPNTEVTLHVWRAGNRIAVPVMLDRQPVPPAELPSFIDEQIEFSVREIAFEDRVSQHLPPDEPGVIVENVVSSGWAALAGLRDDDIVVALDGVAIADVPAFQAARDAALAGNQEWWILKLKRAHRTVFVEINLAPIRS